MSQQNRWSCSPGTSSVSYAASISGCFGPFSPLLTECFSWMGASDECSGSSIEVCIGTHGLMSSPEAWRRWGSSLPSHFWRTINSVWELGFDFCPWGFSRPDRRTPWAARSGARAEGWTTDLLRSFPTWNILRAGVCRCSAPAFLKCLFGTTT